MELSVIIPVYKVEAYIEPFARSMMEQTLTDGVEFLFVDDASPDSSISILRQVIERYPQRKVQVQILTHAENLGLPAARNTGLAAATGTYIYHADSDDLAEPNLLEGMLSEALRTDADVVWCDWSLMMHHSRRPMPQPTYATPTDAVKGMLAGQMRYNVWNKLVRHTLYTDHSISFPSGFSMGEDMTMILLTAHARKVSHLPQILYHYRKTNAGAMTQAYSNDHLRQLRHNIDRVCSYLRLNFPDNGMEQVMAFFKLEAKFPFLLMSPFSRGRRLWQEWFPEANGFIPANTYISSRSRRLQQWAASGRWHLVNAYRILLTKIIYGILYR